MDDTKSQMARSMRVGGLVAAAALASTALPALADEGPNGEIVVRGTGLEKTPGTPAYSTVEIGRDAITTSASTDTHSGLVN
ncbi:MAG: hypothetical protein VW891_17315, partial [Novosphingobium sp.]